MAFEIFGSKAGNSATEDEATAVPEETTPDPASALEPPPTEELKNNKEQTSLEKPPSKLEEPSSLMICLHSIFTFHLLSMEVESEEDTVKEL
eukprot:gene15891-7223_t